MGLACRCRRADESVASYLASTAPQVQKKCAQPACGDPATHHLKTFLHGRTRVTLSVTVVPAPQALPDAEHGQIWVWARPLYGDTTPDPAVRRVRLSQEAGCLSFGEASRSCAEAALRSFLAWLGCDAASGSASPAWVVAGTVARKSCCVRGRGSR